MTPRIFRCARRVRELEGAIRAFLDAEAAGEMSNRDKAIERLIRVLGRS